MKLGMLGMWHSHADGIVRRVAEHPDEFTLVGFYDSDPRVVADRRTQWQPPACQVKGVGLTCTRPLSRPSPLRLWVPRSPRSTGGFGVGVEVPTYLFSARESNRLAPGGRLPVSSSE